MTSSPLGFDNPYSRSLPGRMIEEFFVLVMGASAWALSILVMGIYHPVRERKLRRTSS